MKKIIIAMLVIGSVQLGKAQMQSDPFGTGMAFGFNLGQYQKDFCLGLNVTSPYFLYNSVAVRVKGNMMFYEHVMDGEVTWTPYNNLSIGLVGVGGNLGSLMRLYGEGGVMMIFPSSDFSAQSNEWGGYGLFGFEFFFQPHFNYFIEIGGAGTGARADKLPTKPIYSNGLIIQTGFRVQL